MKRILIYGLLVAILCLTACLVLMAGPDGDTTESRQAMLRKLPKKIEWTIDSEIQAGDMLIASMRSPELDGLSVFRPLDRGRHACISTHYRQDGEIVIANVQTGEGPYIVCWLDHPEAVQVNVRVATASGEETLQFPVQGSEILYFAAPEGDYDMVVSYLLSDGTIFM